MKQKQLVSFCRTVRSYLTKLLTLRVDDHFIEPSSWEHNSTRIVHSRQVESILRKIACGIETLYTVNTPEKLPNASVLGLLQHRAVLLNIISQHLIATLKMQLTWANKACFTRNRLDSYGLEIKKYFTC